MRVNRHKATRLWLLLAAGVLLTAGAALCFGGVEVAPQRVFSIIFHAMAGHRESDPATRIVLNLRLPRVVLVVAVGAALSLAGVAAQTLFRNPLASPYVLGVANGAAVGAVAVMLTVGNALGRIVTPAASLCGGLLTAGIVLVMARRSDRLGHSLLLAGIAVSAFCSALTAAALYVAGQRLRTLVFWLMGGMWLAGWRDVLLVLPIATATLLGLAALAPAMNVALAGERAAADLGVNVRRLHLFLLIAVSVPTAAAVATSGVIGFVGLIVPHFARRIVGADHRRLIPASAAGGAMLLLVADTLARTVAAPAEIPLGVVTALVGRPRLSLDSQTPGKGRCVGVEART